MKNGKKIVIYAMFPVCELGIWLMSLILVSDFDLQARWFGIFVGLTCGIVVYGISRLFFSNAKRPKIVIFSVLEGYAVGALVDGLYAIFRAETLAVFQWGPIFALGFWLSKTPKMKREEIGLETSLLVTLMLTIFMTLPTLRPTERTLTEGIYIYANDVVYNYPILNVFSSRIALATHSGLCYLTQNPAKIQNLRQKQGLPPLRMRKIGHGWWIQDLNLDVRDTDGFTNYGSRTSLDDRPFPFDLEHLGFYLNGHSVNDRLQPAIRLQKLPTPSPVEKWLEIVTFRDNVNTQHPDGFIYSPIPFQGKYVRYYNCNTMTVGIADRFLNRGVEAEELSALPFSMGKQRVADGREWLREYDSKNFEARLKKERQFLRTASAWELPLLHHLLNRREWK